MIIKQQYFEYLINTITCLAFFEGKSQVSQKNALPTKDDLLSDFLRSELANP